MGIETKIRLKHIGNSECAAIDRKVMAAVFDIHSEFGRLHDEVIYKRELAMRCRAMGFNAQTEVPTIVSLGDFRKGYFMDLVIDQSVVYELKATQVLTDSHESQLYHYLMLADGRRGKLVNFGSVSVKSRFLNRTISEQTRHEFILNTSNWKENDERSEWLRITLTSILNEWGIMLQGSLIREAIIHFAGGEETIVKPVEIWSNGSVLGTEKFVLLQSDTALVITTLVRPDAYRKQLVRKLQHTKLKRFQWVNMHKHNINLSTIEQV